MAESEEDAAGVVEDGDADPVRLCGVGRARSGRSAVRCPVLFTGPFYTVTGMPRYEATHVTGVPPKS